MADIPVWLWAVAFLKYALFVGPVVKWWHKSVYGKNQEAEP